LRNTHYFPTHGKLSRVTGSFWNGPRKDLRDAHGGGQFRRLSTGGASSKSCITTGLTVAASYDLAIATMENKTIIPLKMMRKGDDALRNSAAVGQERLGFPWLLSSPKVRAARQ